MLYSFAYDREGRLTAIEDSNGNQTLIERNAQGAPLRIVSPFGQATELGLDAGGWLATVSDPGGIGRVYGYTDLGLLASYTDPNGSLHQFAYDELGRLVRDTDPVGGFTSLSRTEIEDGWKVAKTTAEGRTTAYTVETLSTGEQRMVNTFPDGTVNATLHGPMGARARPTPTGPQPRRSKDPIPGSACRRPSSKALPPQREGSP
jgi:YD repeat-containing protein